MSRADHYSLVEQSLRAKGLNPTPKKINRLVDGMLAKGRGEADMPNKCGNCGDIDWLAACPCGCPLRVCSSCVRTVRTNLGRP